MGYRVKFISRYIVTDLRKKVASNVSHSHNNSIDTFKTRNKSSIVTTMRINNNVMISKDSKM